MIELDQNLMDMARRPPGRPDTLSLGERVAINLFRRKNEARHTPVPLRILAEVFQCSKNTLYYTSLTGKARSYINHEKGDEVNALIAEMGEDAAWAKYVTPEMINACNIVTKAFVEAA